MIVLELLGRHGEVLKTVSLPTLFKSISIREEPTLKEHFPELPGFPAWDPKRKVSDLPAPPTGVR